MLHESDFYIVLVKMTLQEKNLHLSFGLTCSSVLLLSLKTVI